MIIIPYYTTSGCFCLGCKRYRPAARWTKMVASGGALRAVLLLWEESTPSSGSGSLNGSRCGKLTARCGQLMVSLGRSRKIVHKWLMFCIWQLVYARSRWSPCHKIPLETLGCHAVSAALPKLQVSPTQHLNLAILGAGHVDWDWDMPVFSTLQFRESDLRLKSVLIATSKIQVVHCLVWCFWGSKHLIALAISKENLQGILELEQRILGRNSPGKLELLGITWWRCWGGWSWDGVEHAFSSNLVTWFNMVCQVMLAEVRNSGGGITEILYAKTSERKDRSTWKSNHVYQKRVVYISNVFKCWSLAVGFTRLPWFTTLFAPYILYIHSMIYTYQDPPMIHLFDFICV